MNDFRENLDGLFELHRVARGLVEDAVSPDDLLDFDNAFLTFIVISTASHIEEENKAAQRKIKQEKGWDDEKVPALIKFLWHFTTQEERGNGDSEFTEAVDAYVKLRKARNHLAHKNVLRSVFPYEWGETDVRMHCERALEFTEKFRKCAENFVGREREVREETPAAP